MALSTSTFRFNYYTTVLINIIRGASMFHAASLSCQNVLRENSPKFNGVGKSIFSFHNFEGET